MHTLVSKCLDLFSFGVKVEFSYQFEQQNSLSHLISFDFVFQVTEFKCEKTATHRTHIVALLNVCFPIVSF